MQAVLHVCDCFDGSESTTTQRGLMGSELSATAGFLRKRIGAQLKSAINGKRIQLYKKKEQEAKQWKLPFTISVPNLFEHGVSTPPPTTLRVTQVVTEPEESPQQQSDQLMVDSTTESPHQDVIDSTTDIGALESFKAQRRRRTVGDIFAVKRKDSKFASDIEAAAKYVNTGAARSYISKTVCVKPKQQTNDPLSYAENDPEVLQSVVAAWTLDGSLASTNSLTAATTDARKRDEIVSGKLYDI